MVMAISKIYNFYNTLDYVSIYSHKQSTQMRFRLTLEVVESEQPQKILDHKYTFIQCREVQE